MGHRVGLLAQIQQRTRDAAGNVEKGQVSDLARGVAQAFGHLAAEGIENVRILLGQLAEFRVAQLGHFALGFCADPSATFLVRTFLFEKPHLSEKVARVQVSDDHLAAVIILDKDGDRAFDNEKKRLATVASVNDRAFCRVPPSMAVREQLVDILYLDLGRE